MLTKNGYFGWGPDNMYKNDRPKELRVGDKIAIVFGCSTPLAVRPRADKFEVVGSVRAGLHGRRGTRSYAVRGLWHTAFHISLTTRASASSGRAAHATGYSTGSKAYRLLC